MQLLSVELVRRLSRELHSPEGVDPAPYLSTLPVGWYRAEFDALVQGTEDIEQARQLVLVMDTEQDAYERYVEFLIAALPRGARDTFGREDASLAAASAHLADWATEFFGESEPDEARTAALFALARHVAQTGTRPPFFAFEERARHDLDAVARDHVSTGLGLLQIHQSLRAEFDRADRFWRALYPTFDLFSRHHHTAQLRVIAALEHGRPLTKGDQRDPLILTPPAPPEVTDEVKRAVLVRDGYRCLCCGSAHRRSLQVDHVAPSYFGGSHDMDNLQTLCGTCNRSKALNELNFRHHASPLQGAPAYALLEVPRACDPRDMDAWDRHIRRTLNFFYRCAAVQDVTIKQRGPEAGHWRVTLYPGNEPQWATQGLLTALQEQIADARLGAGLVGPYTIAVDGH